LEICFPRLPDETDVFVLAYFCTTFAVWCFRYIIAGVDETEDGLPPFRGTEFEASNADDG